MNGRLREMNGKFHMIIQTKNESGEWKQKSISTRLEIKGNKKKAEEMLENYLKGKCENSLKSEDSNQILFVDYL